MYTEGFKAFVVPADKREAYFDFIHELQAAAPVSSQTVDAYNDPVIIINDLTLFSKHNQERILAFFKRIEAEDITEGYLKN